MGPWRRAVISWINVLQLLPGDVGDFKEILGTQFFHNFLREICGEEDLDLGSSLNHTIIQFVKREYPKFEVDWKALQHDETELLTFLSLLLFHSLVKGSEITRGKMCRALDDETQLVVKSFLERLVPSSDVLIKDYVRWAVCEADDRDSEGLSQTLFSTSPEPRKALHIFLHSPVTRQQKVVHEKYKEVRKLELKLESETYEKNYLKEELLQSENRLRQMSSKYEEKVKEVRKLQSALVLQEADEGQQDSAPNVAKEQNYNLVIEKLKNKVTELEQGTCALNQQNEELRKQVKIQSGDIVKLNLKLEEAEEYLVESDRLEDELRAKSKQLDALTERCHDLEKLLEETNACDADPRHNLSALSFTGEVEDLARSVTDLVLCEEKERNKVLTEKVEELMLSLVDFENIKAHNSSLQEQLKTVSESRQTVIDEFQTANQLVKLLECRIADLESENATLLEVDHELQDVQENARKLHQTNINLEAHSRLLTEQIRKEQECVEKLGKEKMVQENTFNKQMRQIEEEKLVLEQQIENLRSDNREKTEKLGDISSRNEALQVQKESLEEKLAQEQKLLHDHKDKLKQLSYTIEELGEERVKLEEKYLEAQLNVETLVKEKQDKSERLVSALGGVCKVLGQGVASLVGEQVSPQEPTSPEEAIVLATELVDRLLHFVTAKSEECESLEEKCDQLVQTASRMEEEKLVLERQIETLQSDNQEDTEKLGEISSRYEALQVQKESLEKKLVQEQKLLHDHQDKLKQLSYTIEELGEERVKLEEKYLEAQLNVETLVREKQDKSERLVSALGGVCKVLGQGVASLVGEQVSPQEPTSPEEATVLATELVDRLLHFVTSKSEECESLEEKCDQLVQTASRMEEEKLVLERQIETLQSDNQEDAEKLGEISSRYEALQVQKESLEKKLVQEQKLLHDHQDKLKQLSYTIEELGEERVKLEEKYLEAQLNVETLVKEKQDMSERLVSALGGVCKVLGQGVASLVGEQVSPQEPTSPEEAIVLATELVDRLLHFVTAKSEECESLEEKCDQLVQTASRMEEEKLVLERQIETLQSDNQEDAEKLGEISSRYEALQVQKESLEKKLVQEQKLLHDHQDKLKQLSYTIEELGEERVKLEEKYFEAQLNVETLVREKQDKSERLVSALGGVCKVLGQGIASLVGEQVSPQEPTSPEEAIVLATELVDRLLHFVTAKSEECESLEEKCDQLVQTASRMEEEKLVLERQIETLQSDNQEDAEKLGEISSRYEALQVQKESLEKKLVQEQKLLHDHQDKLKQLSYTIEELGEERVKLEEKYLEAQLNVETLVKEKQDKSERLVSALGGVCKVLGQGVASLVGEQVSPQEPTSPEEAIVLATELVDRLLHFVTSKSEECESLGVKYNNFRELMDRRIETDEALSEVLALLQVSFSKHLVALGNGRGTPEAAWCSQSLEAVECCLAAVTGGGLKAAADLRRVSRKVRLLEERPDAHECAASYAAKLRERFKAEYSSIQKQLEARQAQLSEARATFRSMREKMEAEVLQRVEVVKEEYKGKLDSLKATMKEAYDAEVGKVKVGEAQLKAFAEELKAKYRQLAREKQQLQEELLRVKGRAECHDFVSDVAAGTGGGDVTEETVTYVSRRRRSVRTSGMGRMFPEEDEQGEEFNNTYLADMKAGVCLPEDRLGELRYRNSLCPPHLQSSYPAETQFQDPSHFKDEDLMVGFPQDSARRKDRGYRKPGPPTPGKKGRPVVGEETPTPRRALKEANSSSSSTPSRVKALFGLGRVSRRDENVPTPRTKALGLFRRPHKRL